MPMLLQDIYKLIMIWIKILQTFFLDLEKAMVKSIRKYLRSFITKSNLNKTTTKTHKNIRFQETLQGSYNQNKVYIYVD